MIKLLVTGCNGQLGRSLREIIDNEPGIEAVWTDIDTLDITDRHQVNEFINEKGFTHIVNCAAFTAVDRAEKEEVAASAINTEAVGNLAAAARLNRIRVIHISTDYVFPGESHRPYDERDEPDPKSIYGRTKLEGEFLLKSFCPDSIIIRTSWLYSEYGNNFVKTILSKMRENTPLNVVSDQIGTPTYAADLADVICHILKGEEWVPGIFHYSDEGVASWYDFAQAIAHLSNRKGYPISAVSTNEYPTAAKRPHYSVLSKKKIKKAYGLLIPYWGDSLAKCLENLNDL